MKAKHLLACLASLLVLSASLYGQAVSTDQVAGVVQDQTGAVIVGAQVELKATDTGQIHTAVTDTSGHYALQELPVGPYSLQVTKTGFTTYIQNGIVLQVGINPTINATLQVGAQTQQVVVEANAAMVETENTGIGQVINSQQVEDLPLNGREVTQLITLSGATTTASSSVGDLNSNKNYGANNPNMNSAVVTDSVAGGQGNTVKFVMDGGLNNDPRNDLNAALPFPDAIQEFNVQTSSLGARYGQNSTAAVNVVTKNGTNAFHGDAFEYVRNFMFNARAADQTTRDSLKRNQFGGVLGGPIKKDKLFFFGGYQGTIVKSNPNSSNKQLPTAAEVNNGDFSALTNPANGCGLTKGVLLNQSNPAFPEFNASNQFVPSALYPTWASANAPLTQTILKYLPVINDPSNPCGFAPVPVSQDLTDKETIGRVDWNASSKNSVFARYFLAINDQPTTWDQKDFLELNKMHTYEKDQEATIGWTYTATPNLINNLHLTGNRDLNLRIAPIIPFGGATRNPSGLRGTGGDCTANPNAQDCSIQMYSIIQDYFPISVGRSAGGFGGFLGGGTNPGYFNSTLFQVADDVDWARGKHDISFGFEYIHEVANTVNTRPDNGSFSFTGNALRDPKSARGSTIPLADFLTGWITPSSFTQGNSLLDNDWKPYYGAYIQDNWHVRTNLSVNLGVRFEPYIQPKNSNGHVSNFQLPAYVALEHTKVYVNAPDGLFFPGDPGYPGNQNSVNHLNKWSPRVGVVWDPTGSGKTSIRAGFGIFNNAAELFNYNHEASNPPWGDILNADTNAGDVLPMWEPWANYGAPNPFPAALQLSANSFFPTNVTLTNQPLDMPSPYSMQWNFSVQHQFGSWLIAANYMGNAARHLQSGYPLDPTVFVPGTVAGGQCTVGAGGQFVGGPFAGLPDGLPAGYGGNCSADNDGTSNDPTGVSIKGDNSVSNLTQRQYFYENAINKAGQAQYFGDVPQMDPGATSNYEGLLLSANHRLSSNFSLLANYTWSHCLALPVQNEWQGGEEYPVGAPISPSQPDFQYRSLAYTSCDSDVRHVMNASVIANTPKFSGRLMNAILGGWQLSVIGTFRTGTYQFVSTGQDFSKTAQPEYVSPSGSAEYVSNKGGVDASNKLTSFRRDWLSSAGFSTPAVGAFAASWARIENPNFFEIDTGLVRNFKIRESQSIQFRWETFNIDNHVNLGAPSTSFSSGTFGQISGAAGQPRIMQFALKYIF